MLAWVRNLFARCHMCRLRLPSGTDRASWHYLESLRLWLCPFCFRRVDRFLSRR